MEEELAQAQQAHLLASSNASISANLVLDKTGVVLGESVLMMAVMSSTLNLKTQEINGNLERGLKSSTVLVNRESSVIDARLKMSYKNMSNAEVQSAETAAETTETAMEGYLLKQSSNVVKNWSRKYFMIRNGKFYYCDDNDSSGSSDRPKRVLDIALTAAKPRPDIRRLCFEVIAPTKTLVLQAENMADYKKWMAVMNNARADALEAKSVSETATVLSQGSASASAPPGKTSSSSLSTSSSTVSANPAVVDKSSIIETLWSLQPENRVCCDCGAESKKRIYRPLLLSCFYFFFK